MSAARIELFRDAGVLINVEPTTNAGTCKAVGQTVLSPIPAKHLDEQTLFGFGEVFGEVDGACRVVRRQVCTRPVAGDGAPAPAPERRDVRDAARRCRDEVLRR